MIFETIERGIYWLSSFVVGGDASALCQIRAPIDAHTLVLENNSLMTLFRVIGSRRHIGREEFSSQSQALSDVFNTLLSAGNGGKQHSILMGFRSDPDSAGPLLKNILGPSFSTAKRLGADADFLFQDNLAAMLPHCIEQISVFGVLTHAAGLSPSELERWGIARAAQFEAMAKAGYRLDPEISQTPMSPPNVMMARHSAAVSTLMEKISSPGSPVQVMMDKMTSHEAIAVIRRFLDASLRDGDWKPQLLGDRPAAVNVKRSSGTIDQAFPIKIGRQLVTEKVHEIFGDAELAKRGSYWYATLAMDVFPQDAETKDFASLAESLRTGGTVPYQLHFDVSPNGMSFNQLNRMLAAFVGAAGEHNRSIRKGQEWLKELKESRQNIIALRALFTTWAKTEEQCVERLSLLKSKIDGWGSAVTSNEIGAPAHALFASAPGFSKNITAPYIAGPLSDMVRVFPMFMPSSVWKTGQLIPFTVEGRPYPIAFGTPLQPYWGTLIFAPTGTGKSFMMNLLNQGILFTPGSNDIPMVTIIDKGPSAKGVVDLARAILPPEVASQIAYWRPTPSDTRYRVNPWDTQHGCDKPLESDKDFLSALLGGIAPNLGAEGGKFIGAVISVAYETYSRLAPTAKRWSWSIDVGLSEKLEKVGIHFQEDAPPRVWDVVDAFFKAGMIEESQKAQYFAVPRMEDITTILQDSRIQRAGEASLGDGPGNTVLKVFERNIIAAANEYKVFFGTTQHTSKARFTVVDIEGMASASTSEEGKRRFGLMLLFARRLGARDFFLHPDDMNEVCPPLYRSYQMTRVQKIKEELKFLEYDEIHNAKGIGAVQELLQKDAREGRKYNVVGILASQDLGDFPPDLVKNCYNFFILGVGNAMAARELKAVFDLADSEVKEIMDKCTKPGTMFGMFKTNRGLLSQVLVTRPGSVQKWAFNTNSSDMAFRDALYARFGVKKALTALIQAFPDGSVRDYLDEMRRTMGDDRVDDDGLTEMAIRKLMPDFERTLAGHKVVG